MVLVVTGGSGFIGSHVVDALLEKGYQVRVFDKNAPSNTKAEWFKGDLLSSDDAFQGTKDAEAVFHLGAVADVNVATTDPELCIKVNELGTLNLLRACSGQEVEHIILASSVWVYGRASGTVREETPIPFPRDVYTKTKIGQEQLVFSWAQSHSLPYTILRYDIPFGPRMRANMAIASFVRKAIRKEPITIYGDGKQGRCWVFISDLADAHCQVLTPHASNEIINLAGEEFVTISDIVDLLSKTFGTLPIKRQPPRPDDFEGVRTSIEKAARVLGWSPSTSFNEGLAKYIAHVQAGLPHNEPN